MLQNQIKYLVAGAEREALASQNIFLAKPRVHIIGSRATSTVCRLKIFLKALHWYILTYIEYILLTYLLTYVRFRVGVLLTLYLCLGTCRPEISRRPLGSIFSWRRHLSVSFLPNGHLPSYLFNLLFNPSRWIPKVQTLRTPHLFSVMPPSHVTNQWSPTDQSPLLMSFWVHLTPPSCTQWPV